ncbi:hypothetical protein CDD81_2620 [Ophiocordyceps australis]|uniref:Ribosomal RNA-processing protein 14/surfeit locus protein 6 C-terminal domain-containing protein n=1 Tax=Ophiocordyceps australis TaxID=1399860 RepID=A0A2C5XXR7_9HYPO|nr:hypothetical protein CDD81_2620 [Ophiocordyceps australis]
MSDCTLQSRLRDHAKAFDGLLSLIPATKYYPPEDATGQWKRKKQSKQEAAAARRCKLDPDSQFNRNAKEVMDERASNKRKSREMQHDDLEANTEPQADDGDIECIQLQRHAHESKVKIEKSSKRPKIGQAHKPELNSTTQSVRESTRDQEKSAKRGNKTEKKACPQDPQQPDAPSPVPHHAVDKNRLIHASVAGKKHRDATCPGSDAITKPKHTRKLTTGHRQQTEAQGSTENVVSRNVLCAQNAVEHSAASISESDSLSRTFDASDSIAPRERGVEHAASSNTSVSPTILPSDKPRHLKIPVDTTALRARLAAKIEALRAARKADGPDGKPIRTRQELIEARRAKEAQRKAHKKELRRKAKLEEARKREEELASNSPGVMSPSVELDETTTNISFGRVIFNDGSQMSHDLSYVLNQGRKKGPSDPKTALLKVQNQKKRLQDLDAEKQADVADKEAWLTARRRFEGDKIRDDEGMLKKAVRRKEAIKKKSEKAWKERVQGVEYAQKERQKKREDNIKRRREEKTMGKAGKRQGGSKMKKRGRPGFEGRLDVISRRK